MRTYVFYHRGCLDGFGAAWSAWKQLGDGSRYVPHHPAQPFPDDLRPGSRVLILDLGLPRERLMKMVERHSEVQVVDHHSTWEDEMADLPFVTFDRSHSAAVLSWRIFQPDREVPVLLRHVEDSDLARFEMEDTRAVTAALSSYPMEFELWDRLDVDGLRREGEAIQRYREKVAGQTAGNARLAELAGHRVPVVNATSNVSLVCDRLLEEHPDAPFAGAYRETASGDRRWSLRSRGEVDVASIAEDRGGGGHPAASGFLERLPPGSAPGTAPSDGDAGGQEAPG